MSTMPARHPLGISLESQLMVPPVNIPTASLPAPKPGFMAPGSKGAMIAGIIGDTLASFTGGQPLFTQNLLAERKRKQDAEAEQAKWGLKRQADREDKQWEWQNKPPEVPSIIRETQAWQSMTPEQRVAYQAMQDARSGPIMTTLPNGQFYSGPKSGLPGALGAGAPPAIPTAPVGKLRPITGGAVPPASRPFSGPVPQKLKTGFMTSGRRTPQGNALVGGVPNSAHLRGDAVDYDGPDLNALLVEVRQTMNPDKAFIHRGHVHTEKRGLNAPYFGKNGTAGLRSR